MRCSAGLLVAVSFAFGCSDNTAHPVDAARDGQITVNLPDVPPGCPPSAGNENGIGAPCTANGGECGGSLTCSCDDRFNYPMPAGMPCFCTNLVFANTCSSCGSNASCCVCDLTLTTTPITVSACFPSVCLGNGQCPVVDALTCRRS